MNMGGNAGGTLSPYLTPLLGAVFAAPYGPELGWRLSLAIAGAVVAAGAILWVGIEPSTEAWGDSQLLAASNGDRAIPAVDSP